MYADYAYYTGTYYGTKITTEALYNQYGTRASDYLDYCTMGTLDADLPTDETALGKIKKACCRLADEIYTIESRKTALSDGSGSGAIKSVSSGGESVSYELSEVDTLITKGKQAIDQYLYAVTKTYLSGVSDDSGYLYLYRGL